jgi:(p)ppGpp synthase/HD superfamily hydrolase
MVMIDKNQELKFLISTYEPWGCNYRGPMVLEALRFAHEAHTGQVRKYSGEPYLFHPIEVMHIVEITTYGAYVQPIVERMMCAALLHDVVEDTPRTFADVDATFGAVVAQMVAGMTAPSKPSDGNRAARMKIDVDYLAGQSEYAQTIKCADIISNVKSIAQYDKKFAATYVEEKSDALAVCTRALLATKLIAESVVAMARRDL